MRQGKFPEPHRGFRKTNQIFALGVVLAAGATDAASLTPAPRAELKVLLALGGRSGQAHGINDAGQIVGLAAVARRRSSRSRSHHY